MKKLTLILIAFALLLGVEAEAGTTLQPTYNYTIIIDGVNPVDKPPCFIRRVRYAMIGANEARINSGDVLMWDTSSADGVTVSRYVDGTTDTQPTKGVAGVAITNLLTQDSGSNADITDDNYGYMAVGGWCLAKTQGALSSAGYTLVPISADNGCFGTSDLMVKASMDCGTLLNENTTNGLNSVWLHLQ